MTDDSAKRNRVLAAAAEVYSEKSIALAGRRDIARAADVPLRTVSGIGRHRVDLLREVVEQLPFPPVAEHLAAQAAHPSEPALQALLRAARDVLGDPGAAWDPLELQAIVAAPYDEPTRRVVVDRLNNRWEAAQEVVRQLRGVDATQEGAFSDDAAALHIIAVGLGLALLSPLSERWSDARSWTALAARLLLAVPGGLCPGGLAAAGLLWHGAISSILDILLLLLWCSAGGGGGVYAQQHGLTVLLQVMHLAR